ncbi:phage major capsid protein [Syntrophus buswellii]|uniref:phage major capsid protein n=1 Tax=Syntrophus buswellii TaxID=43774 RepID=UPI0038D383C4
MEKRNFEIDVGSIRAESRTVSASLSSEFPVMRYDGEEILSHKPEAVDLSRAPLPLLRAHDNSSLPVGVVEKLVVADGKLKGEIRLSSNQEALWADIQDGILRNLSIGYQITEKQKTKRGYIATRWRPYEVSLVAAPADNTIGIGRNLNQNVNHGSQRSENKMDRNDILKARKAAIDELSELAKSGENADRMEDLKGEIRAFDARLEAFEMADTGKKDGKSFTPDLQKENRSLIQFVGGPATDRTYAGMFNQGRKLEVNEEEIRAFRASMKEGTPSAGGFSVPEPLAAQWLDSSIEGEIIRPRATVWPMESATRKVPGWDCSTQTGGSMFGGFAMEFLAEEGTGNKQTGKLRAINLSAKKGAIFVDASNELVEDGLGFDAQLDRAMRSSIGYGLDKYFISGTAGQPLGILNDPALITVAKEAGQVKDSIIWENISKMFARMYPEGRKRAVWLVNNSAIPQLLSLTIAIGTGGSHIPVMTESSREFKILGRPVIFTSHMPALGDANDICFVDLSQYAIGLRRDVRLEKSIIPGWTQDLMSYRAILRFDGQGTWSGPITPENGDTLSWVVGLAERA